MAERTRRRKARSAGARKTTKRARPKGRAARGKAANPKKTRRKPKAVKRRSHPSPRRPPKATTPVATPQAPASADGHPEPPASPTEDLGSGGNSGQASASDADNTQRSIGRGG